MKSTGLDQIMLRPANLATVFDMGKSTVNERIRELEGWIDEGRYPRTAVIHDGKIVLVNRLAFVDYLANRQRLMNRNARKLVPPYNPAELAKDLALIQIPITHEQELQHIENSKGKKQAS